jgi:hypothetical protein
MDTTEKNEHENGDTYMKRNFSLCSSHINWSGEIKDYAMDGMWIK